MLPRGRVYRYPPGRALPDVPMTGVPGGMLSVPYDMGGMPLRDTALSQPIPIGALASALANATPEHQRTVCISICVICLLKSDVVHEASCISYVICSFDFVFSRPVS